MVRAFRYHTKPVFWLVVIFVGAVAAYATLQQVTFVPGVPVTGHVQVYLILLALWIVGILGAWFIVQLLRFLVRR